MHPSHVDKCVFAPVADKISNRANTFRSILFLQMFSYFVPALVFHIYVYVRRVCPVNVQESLEYHALVFIRINLCNPRQKTYNASGCRPASGAYDDSLILSPPDSLACSTEEIAKIFLYNYAHLVANTFRKPVLLRAGTVAYLAIAPSFTSPCPQKFNGCHVHDLQSSFAIG